MTTKPVVAAKEKLGDFYQELEQLLRKQLEAQPANDDVRLKLMELYFEQHRAEDFLRAAREFRRLLKKPAESHEWQRTISMGRMLHPGEPLFSGAESDRIEFIGPTGAVVQKDTARIRRFGDDERHRPLFDTLANRYAPLRSDVRFLAEYEVLLVGGLATRRPTPLFHVKRLSEAIGGAQIYVKREDLAGESPHLTAAVTGQACVAHRLGCKTLVTGTPDGRRGVIAAAVATRLGLKAIVFMEPEQAERNATNALFIKLMGAELRLVKTKDLRNRDVREAALAHWAEHPQESFLVTGLDAAPAPFPMMTMEFTSAIGRECRRQVAAAVRGPAAMIVTRGTNTADAIGLLPAFFADAQTRLVCVDPERMPEPTKGDTFVKAGPVLTTSEKKVAQNILDRLEYPSVAREHALLRASGRVEYVETPRQDARQALLDLARHEGLVPPIETAHALAWACAEARKLRREQAVVVMMNEQVAKDTWDIKRLVEGGAS